VRSNQRLVQVALKLEMRHLEGAIRNRLASRTHGRQILRRGGEVNGQVSWVFQLADGRPLATALVIPRAVPLSMVLHFNEQGKGHRKIKETSARNKGGTKLDQRPVSIDSEDSRQRDSIVNSKIKGFRELTPSH